MNSGCMMPVELLWEREKVVQLKVRIIMRKKIQSDK